ncbi:ABC transporter F family member 4-like [Ylistrum balloti]|uniref:ABC transporter F family member 4-like n=1 Tax=Ylistrum balloti TaxID=509963 RepID=UPI002905EFC4|nr:ABC transporter F family member 4-like [Ylistrum balloti]
MPRSRRSTGKSPAPVVKEEAPTTRKTRGSSAPAVETPSPKKSRKRSPSPSPAPRGRSRGRGAKDTKQEKGQGDDEEMPSPKKGRVTRAVVQQEEAPSRGRAGSRKAAEQKKPAPSPTQKSRSSSRQKTAPTPTKTEQPKAETSRSRSRSKAAKPEPKTPEPKPAKSKSQPKSQTKKTPAKKATPVTVAKPNSSPKSTGTRSSSRGKKEEKASDMPSAQIILTKIDSPSKSNNTKLKEVTSPSASRGRSSAKSSPQKASPKASRRSKSTEKSTPPARRGRKSAEAEEKVEDAEKDEGKEVITENEKVETTKDEETVEESAVSEEATKDEGMDTEDDTAEVEDKVEEKESNDVNEKENEIEKENEVEEEEEEMKDEEMKDEEVKDKESKEEVKDEMEGETEVNKEENEVKNEENESCTKPEESVEEEMEKEEVDKKEPCEPEKEEPSVETIPPSGPSPVKQSASPATQESKPPEIEAISDDEDAIEEQKDEPMEEGGGEEQKEEQAEVTPAAEESEAAKVEAPQEVSEPATTDREQQNGSSDDPLSSPTRKRKWGELDDKEEDLSPKKVRRSIDMADVTSEGVVTTNGEDQVSNQEAEEESMETNVDQKALESQVVQTSTDTGNQDIVQDYVVVNMDEIPAANSTEVLQCLPTAKEEATTVTTAEQSQSEVPAAEVVSDINQDQTTASSPVSEVNPVLSRKFIPNPAYQSGDTNKQFSVVSYNILAQCHLERNDYTFTESQYLTESYRHQNLVKEIEYLGADLVCMQEVGPLYFESLLKPAMSKLGYEGVMKKRTQEYFNEGEATFYKTSRFSVIESQTYSLADLAEKELEDGGVSEDVKVSIRKYLDLPDVLVLTKLRCKVTDNVLCVGNIHVQWGKMEIPDAQCIQIVCAIKELAKQGGSDCHAQILCGDFNSEVTSPGYKLAMEGYITDEVLRQLQALENLEMPDSNKAALVNHLWRAFQHTSNLKSAYQSAQGQEPVVTSYNRVMLAAVDYIFYCGGSLHNVGVLETAHEDSIKATGGIPDQHFPSDHVSIKAVFAFS